MSDESIFRFLLVRPTDSSRGASTGSASAAVTFEVGGDRPTPFSATIQELRRGGATAEDVEAAVADFREGGGSVESLDELPFDVRPLVSWLRTAQLEGITGDLSASLEAALGSPIADVVGDTGFASTLARIGDTVLAESLHPRATPVHLAHLVAVAKVMSLLRALEDARTAPDVRSLTRWIDRAPLRLPPTLRRSPTKPTPASSTAPEEPEPDGEPRELLVDLERAHAELSRVATDERLLFIPDFEPTEEEGRKPPEATKVAFDIARLTHLADPEGSDLERLRVALAGSNLRDHSVPTALRRSTIRSLSEPTKGVLESLGVDLDRVHPTGIVSHVEGEIHALSGRIGTDLPTNERILIGGAMLDRDRLRESLGLGARRVPPLPEPHECQAEVGVGDLLIVRQRLKAYELGEFAHVENVLVGESRLREHRRLNLTEETEVSEEESEIEKERNLQSTERNEMQAEAEKTVKSQFALEAGLQISGSYGPSVSFSANLGTSFSTSTEESRRKAVSYSREVSDKTSERVRERVRRELRRRVLEQIEELNRHEIAHPGGERGHIRGIYRWLNKVYDAQIFNYGQRMMYEFVVPEPGSYFLYAAVENPPADTLVVKPDPPRHLGRPLKPSNLTRGNYQDWVAQYSVRNVPEPPPQFVHVSYFDKQDKTEDGSIFGRAGKIELPPGYEAYAATVMADHTFTRGEDHSFHVMLGGQEWDLSNWWGSFYKTLDHRYKELAVAYQLMRAWSFGLGIDVHCELAPDGITRWQQSVYDAIMEAYEQQKAEYEEEMAAREIRRGVQILGRNPLENRRLEREELKKLVLMILGNSVAISRDSMRLSAEPVMDLGKVCENGSWIRFLENAFEWNNMLYVFYPYFWGRKARWISALHFTDPDPDFAAFLRAGAARVQVPVRPGFEKAVAYFAQFGRVWEGEDPPLIDDDLYVPIIEEITEKLGGLDEGVPYPEDSEPWEVRIPTTLVVVQDLGEVPNIRDELTGENIDLG